MRYRNGVLTFDDLAATDIVSRFGSPVYIYEKAVLLRQIDSVRTAFRNMPVRPFYALKANANPEILRIIAEAGFGFDAVSPGEVAVLKRLGIEPERIWFTCSNVSDDDLEQVKAPDIVINVNGMSELDRCVRLKLPNPIALRINPHVGAGHHRDVVTAGVGVKFGFDMAEVDDAVKYADAEGLKIVGVHAHIGSGVHEISPFLDAASAVMEIAREVGSIEWVNLGGGFAVPYRPGEPDFPIEDYAGALEERIGPELQRRGLRAIVEPGRYIVAQCGTLLATVTAFRISEGIEWIGCDSGFNHLARPSKYNAYHHILNASRGDDRDLRTNDGEAEHRREYIVAGNICESGDVFTRDSDGIPEPRPMPQTSVNDLIAFCDAGAYGYSMGSTYNLRALPAEVLVYGSEARVIRQRSTIETMLIGTSIS